MTTISQARTRIYTVFRTDWGATSAVAYDNKDFKPVTDVAFVRLAVRHVDGAQASLGGTGNRKFDRFGTVFVQCFVPLDKGLTAADNLATTAKNVFEGKTLGTEAVQFAGVDVREIGATEDGYFQVNVEAPFYYTETK